MTAGDQLHPNERYRSMGEAVDLKAITSDPMTRRVVALPGHVSVCCSLTDRAWTGAISLQMVDASEPCRIEQEATRCH